MDQIKVINTDKFSVDNIYKMIPRSIGNFEEIRDDVNTILNEVKINGDKAILNYTEKFDDVRLTEKEIQVDKEEIRDAYKYIDKNLIEALEYAKKNLIKFYESQKVESWSIDIESGVEVGQIFRPIESLGIYIPGGRAIYPSTVLMAAAPAYVAGVKDIILCTPPNVDKKVSPEILMAANEFNINKIYKIGGAQAIAAMAYGTKTVPCVDKIVGPGNRWVTVAKQLVSHIVAIDIPAGPSEILIIADDSVSYNYIIADLISQIEHDPDNIGILITDSQKVIKNVIKNLNLYLRTLSRKNIIEKALKKNVFIIKAKNLDECVKISNKIAPEHLELLIKNPNEVLEKINNAGAIFLGKYSPVSLGDYCAGINHILPTGGNAKNYSGLNIYDFLKIIDVLNCSREGIKKMGKAAIKIAEFEGFQAHKKSIEVRLNEKK